MPNKKKIEINFTKYQTKGPDYHYKNINTSDITNFNAYVSARYQIEIELISRAIKKFETKCIKILDVGFGDSILFFTKSKN